MKLECKKCGYVWEYEGEKKGDKNYLEWTSCPRCKSNVKVKEKKQ